MPLYQIKTGNINSKIEQFTSPSEAWNKLRLDVPEDKQAILFVQTEMQVALVQPSKFKKAFYKRYGTNTPKGFEPTKEDPSKTTYWMPIAKGITNHSYKL